jgi:DNA primase
MSNKTVAELLIAHNIPYTNSGKDYVTKCFNPDHNDSNPSFRIDRVSGIAHCFSCGFKFNLFKYYGESSNNASIRVSKIKEKLRVLSLSTKGLEPLEGTRPFNGTHRNISSQTLKEFEAFKTDKVIGLEDRIIFPIKDVRNKVTAYVGRHLLSNGNPRYKIHPIGCELSLYPTRFTEKQHCIILVEGIFDLLNLWDKGLHNVVCTFGTEGLQNHTKEKLLPYKAAGVSKVYIMYDGDEAGRNAAEKLKPLIEEANFEVEVIGMADECDPGDSTQEEVNQLIEYIK